jgi:hypothetical protein
MITDNQVKKLKRELHQDASLETAAAQAGMDPKTARKYRALDTLPSEIKAARVREWRTRDDPFEEVWGAVEGFLEINPGLKAKTLFDHLQRSDPGRFSDGQLRTFQRKMKFWRATKGPSKEIYFPQTHHPGLLSQSDFTCMNSLGVTIAGQPFNHLIYHYVLSYSNWETGTICFSESFESLSEGLQHALWTLGGVPQAHQTDRLTAAVNKPDNPEEFTRMYQGLLDHYGLIGRRINSRCAHENGDVEQRHYRFKDAVDQALMLRGSRDFATRAAYEEFLTKLFSQLNSGRTERFRQEVKVLKALPPTRMDSCTKLEVRVGPSSTIRVKHKVYSVPSRLVGERVCIRLYAERLEVWYGQRHIETIARLRGADRHRIDYRHMIDWLIRKPGAFAAYRFRDDLFPTSRFRMVYDALGKQHAPTKASREYLQILHLAARENEAAVDDVLQTLLDDLTTISAPVVAKHLQERTAPAPMPSVEVAAVSLHGYDQLLAHTREART